MMKGCQFCPYATFSHSVYATFDMASSASKVLPVILCGKSSTVAEAVKQAFQPQVLVTHLCLGEKSAKEEIPKALKIHDENRPLAIVLGGAFDDQAFSEIQDSVRSVGEKTTWLRKDPTKEAQVPPKESKIGYAKEVGTRAKELLLKLAEDQSLFHPDDTVKYY